MYERSAIVLETYYSEILGLDEKTNLKTVYSNYKLMLEEIKQYQKIIETEDKAINEYDNIANKINSIQKEQKKIYESNIELEGERNQLFDLLDESPENIANKMTKIGDKISVNNNRLKELSEEFVQALKELTEKQKERNQYSRERRTEEKNYLQIVEKTDKNIKEIDLEVLKRIKELVNTESEQRKNEILKKLIDNGRDERVEFNKNAMKIAVETRNEIAKKEAGCYLLIYDRTRKLLAELNKDEVKLDKFEKKLKEVSIKLEFLKAQKRYIVSFLDNERIVAINGVKIHSKIMEEACENFESDMEQFNNLYELILKEISGKVTKKAYNELYNKEYLKSIEEKEKNFEEETTNIKIKSGTIISFNYWRMEEIKNIYEVFIREVSEKFNKDVSDLKLEESKEIETIKEDEEVTNSETEEKDYIIASILGENDDIFDEVYENEYIDSEDDFEDEELEDEDNEDSEIVEDMIESELEEDYDDEEDEDEYNYLNSDSDDDEYDENELDDDDEYEYVEDEDYIEDDFDEYEDDEINDNEEENEEEEIEDEEEYEDKKKRGKGLFNKFFKDK